MNVQTLKKLGLLSGLFFTFIAVVISFISRNFIYLDRNLVSMIVFLRYGSYFATAFCYFLSFIKERMRVDFITAAFLGLYSIGAFVEASSTSYGIFDYGTHLLGWTYGGYYGIAAMVSSVSLFFSIIIFIIRARKTNMFLLFIGFCSFVGFCIIILYRILQEVIGISLGAIITSGFSILVSIGIALFWFLETVAEER